MKRPTTPSELEGAALGLLARSGPLTAHAVRKVFLDSAIDHFSGSAGSIYPLIRRFEEEGLIVPSRTADGAKGGVAYEITDAGIAALKAWIHAGGDSSVTSVMFDPLRTRVLSLAVLDRDERLAFLERAETELKHALRFVDKGPEEPEHDVWVQAAYHGAREVIRARLKWIRALMREPYTSRK